MHAAAEAVIHGPADGFGHRWAALAARADWIAVAAVAVTIVAFAMMFQLVPGACALTGGPAALVPC